MKQSIKKIGVGLLLAMSLLPMTANAQGKKIPTGSRPDQANDVMIEQHLDAQIPLDATFKDENGKVIKLGDYVKDKPTVLVMPFYKCAGSCALELEGMIQCFDKLPFNVGKEFNVLAVSIHPKETQEDALAKKKTILEIYNGKGDRPDATNGWHFLTGDWENINKLAQPVGFKYVYDENKNQISHAAGIMILTPNGKVSRYFYGVNYDKKQVKLSLVEAGENKIGNLADKITLFCSAFDMAAGKYTLSIMRLLQIMGTMTVLVVVSSISLMSFRYRRIALRKSDLVGQTPFASP
ncbi:MAG: SCO family protein [Chthonomonadaceae bacterium]|nr:SCO family protein [Chthonomonadaceae bacterium]